MNALLLLKTVHVLSSVLLVGTGFGTAYYLYFTNRTRELGAIAAVSRLAVRADWWFTTPAVVVQPLTGLWLARLEGIPWPTPWLVASICLYGLAGACWLPVVWLQLRLADLAEAAVKGNAELPAQYVRYAAIWEALGYPAFAAMLAVYFLMVYKPSL